MKKKGKNVFMGSVNGIKLISLKAFYKKLRAAKKRLRTLPPEQFIN